MTILKNQCVLRGSGRNERSKNEAKNPAAYHVSRSAVKNVHVAKSGIDKARLASAARTKNLGFRSQKIQIKIIKKIMS